MPDDRAEAVVEAIADSAASGRIGDGKIFVHSLEQVIRIRLPRSSLLMFQTMTFSTSLHPRPMAGVTVYSVKL